MERWTEEESPRLSIADNGIIVPINIEYVCQPDI